MNSDQRDIVGVEDPLTEEERLFNLIADSMRHAYYPALS